MVNGASTLLSPVKETDTFSIPQGQYPNPCRKSILTLYVHHVPVYRRRAHPKLSKRGATPIHFPPTLNSGKLKRLPASFATLDPAQGTPRGT